MREVVPAQPVVVFGSLAKAGRFRETSDIDIALEHEPDGITIFQLTGLLAERLGSPVDIVLLPECRFRSRITREGEVWMPPALTILEREMEADCAVIRDAAGKATERMSESWPGHLEATAYELARLYNVFERLLDRIAEEFENHFEKRGDYHEKLAQRLSLSLPGIRPAFIPADRRPAVRE